MNSVIKKMEDILTSTYDNKKYVDFVNELFPAVSFVAPDKINKEYTNFSSHIEGSTHVGNYKTPDNKKIVILAVKLKNERYVENSRSTQRSYAKKLIENANADAAFIAFYTEGEPKWRVSFVRLDYEMKVENGRLQTATNMTPAKRFSYLVGKNEPCHTAIKRFERFITDSSSNPAHPTLDDLEETFSVEKVTDEFFELYCEKYHQLREQLDTNESFRIEAEQHNFTSVQFAKKLMGQIVFLYFLQKKGWLGVSAWPKSLTEKEYKTAFYARGEKSRELVPKVFIPVGDGTYMRSVSGIESLSAADEEVLAQCVTGNPWGSGPHNFMRGLFGISEKRNVNFYDHLLEPLFYDALNVNRGKNGYCPALHCRIPFLSGGLFEPIDGYDWKHNDFAIPNEIFSNISSKGVREADGILDIFDRYNFTMSEDEPLEREVAIDPEMLGKVFENLLEVKDRKSKGAFYTPREIVHYMCQESLINYLTNAMNVDEDSIREFILYGDFMKDEDTLKEKRQGNGGMYISESLYKLGTDGKPLVNRLHEMDRALQEVRIADPAVGSGAFPLGMLNEIVRARQNISAYLAIAMNANDKRLMYQMDRSPRTMKYQTIRNCIFAADIEPSAVDITQLRLWLSLVIDDEINPNANSLLEGHRDPLPLPNLENNILCGNSLVDEFEGIRLINESELIGTARKANQIEINQSRFDSILVNLIQKQDELFHCEDTEKKIQLKEEISSLRDIIILSSLEDNFELKQKYIQNKREASKPYVLWQLDFARVFREKGGFDIVIGNPPYLESRNEAFTERMKNQLQTRMIRKYGKNQTYITRGSDLLIYFFELAISLINKDGVNTFITQNSWLDTDFGQKFQQFLLKKACPCLVLDTDFKQFRDNANINTIITLIKDKRFSHKDLAFVRLHKAFDAISFSPMNLQLSIDNESMSAKVFDKQSALLSQYKWGFVFNSPAFFLSLVELLRSVGKCAGQINDARVSIGQGLNLNKAFIYDRNILELGINHEAVLPIFTSSNNGVYHWQVATNYIVDESKLSIEAKRIVKDKGIFCFNGNKTKKVAPALIMPRGISNRYYSAYNAVHGFSSSYVDVYIDDYENQEDVVKRIWVFTNSTLFKLYREITGRNNLGGGMLKAEATDIKDVPIYFAFDTKETYDAFEKAKGFVSNYIQMDTTSDEQQLIDKIVYDYLGVADSIQIEIADCLFGLVCSRYSKSKT